MFTCDVYCERKPGDVEVCAGVCCSKTEYICVNEREASGTVRLQGLEVTKVSLST